MIKVWADELKGPAILAIYIENTIGHNAAA